jgi:hypothetical protein
MASSIYLNFKRIQIALTNTSQSYIIWAFRKVSLRFLEINIINIVDHGFKYELKVTKGVEFYLYII